MKSEGKIINGENLKEERLKKYETQDLFSIAAECSRETINNYENGKGDPHLSSLIKLAAALEMPT